MEDILGRELHDGDIVVTKGNQATGDKRAMAVGIYRKKSVRIQGGKWRTAKDMFLVENPTAVELGIKEIILREIELEKAETEIRKKKTANQIADTVGQIYVFSDGMAYLYCGFAHIRRDNNGAKETLDGYLYLPLWYGRDLIIPSYIGLQELNWNSIKSYIQHNHFTSVIDFKLTKNPAKYQKIFPMREVITLPEKEKFICDWMTYEIEINFTR